MLDVLVIGGGNAALCAALMAREAGAIGAAAREPRRSAWRGGNSQHTRNLRCMHDAPQDVLVDAYPEEEYWQDLLKVTGGLTDEQLARLVIRASVDLPRLDAPPRRALPAAAVGRAARAAHQCLLHGRRQGAGQCLLPQRRERLACRSATTRRSTRIELDGDALRRRARRRRAHRGPGLRAGRRRLRVEPRVAARGLGHERARRVAGRQLPDPRHALQPGRAAQVHDRCRRRPHRRSDAGALRRDRRPRAALRRRHLHPDRLRLARRRASTATASASTTRARTSGPSAMRSGAGWWRSSRARSATRSSTARRSAASCRRCFPAHARPTRLPELARAARPGRGRLRRRPSSDYNAACRVGTLRPHGARRLPHRGPGAGQDATGRGRSTRRRSTAMRCGPGSPSPTSA